MGRLLRISTRSKRIGKARAAFERALRASSDSRLAFLRASLVGSGEVKLARGAWNEPGRAVCPLTALVLGRAPATWDEAGAAALHGEEMLGALGFDAREFHAAWDAGLLPRWRLLRLVERERARRAAAGSRIGVEIVKIS
jgi:hypothetical protein